MESTSLPSCIHTTTAFYDELPPAMKALFEEKKVDIKGKVSKGFSEERKVHVRLDSRQDGCRTRVGQAIGLDA